MCGRYTIFIPLDELIRHFRLEQAEEFEPRYNIAPTQTVPVIRQEDGKRSLRLLRWGLVPFWADDSSIGNRLINARAESVSSKPSFRTAFLNRRCIMPASGFFEWKEQKKGPKRPYFIKRKDGTPMAFAGLWERWQGKDGGEKRETFTIITTDANEDVKGLHNRMPVILEPENYSLWLNTEQPDREALNKMMCPAAPGTLTAHPVSKYVNSPTNEGKQCIKSIEIVCGICGERFLVDGPAGTIARCPSCGTGNMVG